MTIKEFVETNEKIKNYVKEGRLIIKPASEVNVQPEFILNPNFNQPIEWETKVYVYDKNGNLKGELPDKYIIKLLKKENN